MQSDIQPAGASKRMYWAGVIVSALATLMLFASGVMKLLTAGGVEEVFTKLGWGDPTLIRGIGIVEIACVIVYAIPRTAVLGAILLTGYLGGAVATHVRVGDQFFGPAIFGVLFWVGLYLRDARIRALIPLRS